MSDENEEDKATIVLDFNKIRDQLAKEEESLVDPLSLDFRTKTTNDDQLLSSLIEEESEPLSHIPIIAFDFKKLYFNKILNTPKIDLISDLNLLNSTLRESEENVLIFYYNSEPKVINQLILQIKEKFPKNKILIVATKLASDKAQLHKNSKYGVNDYLSDPFELSELFEKIKSL